jgi:hypothetical protein
MYFFMLFIEYFLIENKYQIYSLRLHRSLGSEANQLADDYSTITGDCGLSGSLKSANASGFAGLNA